MENSLVNLSSSELALEAILQTFTDMNFILAPDGAILDYRSNNPALPYSFPNSAPSKNLKDIFPSSLTDQLDHALSTVKQTGTIVTLEYMLPISNREHWFDARLIPVSDSKFMLIARDT